MPRGPHDEVVASLKLLGATHVPAPGAPHETWLRLAGQVLMVRRNLTPGAAIWVNPEKGESFALVLPPSLRGLRKLEGENQLVTCPCILAHDDFLGDCRWCGGERRVTKHVAQLVAERKLSALPPRGHELWESSWRTIAKMMTGQDCETLKPAMPMHILPAWQEAVDLVTPGVVLEGYHNARVAGELTDVLWVRTSRYTTKLSERLYQVLRRNGVPETTSILATVFGGGGT